MYLSGARLGGRPERPELEPKLEKFELEREDTGGFISAFCKMVDT